MAPMPPGGAMEVKPKLLCSSDDLQPALQRCAATRASAWPSPAPSFSCWTPRPGGIQSYDPRRPAHHTTKRRGDKDRHWSHSIFPTGPSLCYGSTFSLLFSLYPILPSQPSASGLQMREPDTKTGALQTLPQPAPTVVEINYIYTHVHVHTYLYPSAYGCAYAYRHTYVCLYTCADMCMCVYI